MKQIAVIGAGAMGSGIGQVAAMAGHEVLIYDALPAQIVKSRDSIFASLNKLVDKKKLSDQQSKSVFGRIYFIDHLESIRDCSLVIEAIIENEADKKILFDRIEAIVDDNCIIATNTSSLSVTGFAGKLNRPDRFIGIHFFNPPVLMKLVEIIPALQSSDNVTQQVTDLILSWDKAPVIAKDTPGFIVNRIARPFYGEALRMAEEQLATPEFIDSAMKETGGFKMGPFELMDFIGNDINAAVTRSVWTAMHFDPRYTPSSLQETMVKAGWLGRKTGKGYYKYLPGATDYTAVDVNGSVNESVTKQSVFERIIVMLINEAADALYRGIATRDDIDTAMTLGVNYPKGLLKWADEIGIQFCVDKMDELYDFYKEDRYRCSAGLKNMASAKRTYY